MVSGQQLLLPREEIDEPSKNSNDESGIAANNSCEGDKGYWEYLKTTRLGTVLSYIKTNEYTSAKEFRNTLETMKDSSLDKRNNVGDENVTCERNEHVELKTISNEYNRIRNLLHELEPARQINKFFDLLINKKIVMITGTTISDENMSTILQFLELSNILTTLKAIDISQLDAGSLKLHYSQIIDYDFFQSSFKQKYQIVFLDFINTDLKRLEEHNKNELLKQFNQFNSINNTQHNYVRFSKTLEEVHDSKNDIHRILSLTTTNGSNTNDNKLFGMFTANSLIMSLQGTLNSVYARQNDFTDDNNFIENNNKDKIVIQIYDNAEIKLLLENSISWYTGGISIMKNYKPLSNFKASYDCGITKSVEDSKTLRIDDSILLPSSNIHEYFHKRSIWSKIGSGLREHCKSDYGDLHLYLEDDYNLDFKDQYENQNLIYNLLQSKDKNEVRKKKIKNLVIQLNIVNVKHYGNGENIAENINFKTIGDQITKQVNHLMMEQYEYLNDQQLELEIVTKHLEIDIPALTKDSFFLNNLLERMQGVIAHLTKLNVFENVDNLLFTSFGESFNLLILLLPYLKTILNIKTNAATFDYTKYPVLQSFLTSEINLKKLGILAIDANPQLSPLYSFSRDADSCSDMFKDALSWCLQSNIKISLISTLYDCKKFDLSDKLLLDFLHPNIIRGLFVQNKILNYDSDSFVDGENLQKIPTSRQFEIKLILLLLTCLNSGYILDDTILLLKMISANFQSRAFNDLTITSQLKKKYDKLNKDFVTRKDKLHLDWKSTTPAAIFNGLNKTIDQMEFLNYWMAKKDLDLFDPEFEFNSIFNVQRVSVFEDFKVYNFFINNTLFTSDPQFKNDLIIYDYRKIEAELNNEEEKQFMLIWKLRDYLTNLLSTRNLSSSIINIFSNQNNILKILNVDDKNISYLEKRLESSYVKDATVAHKLIKQLFDLYLVYLPPMNNKNLSSFKYEILDMIWDNYETSNDFFEDISS
ncbi:hypothetical protein QEN19_000644 [Hanseniaspora menglaensis]